LSDALFHGTENLDIQKEIIYYQMAKIFKFKPWEVDKIEFDSVLSMLSLEAYSRKKEHEQVKNGGRKI